MYVLPFLLISPQLTLPRAKKVTPRLNAPSLVSLLALVVNATKVSKVSLCFSSTNDIAEGHQARDCPYKPKICKICCEEGHEALECTGKMKTNLNNVPDKTIDEAWAMLHQASEDGDLDDFKDAVKILSKACPEMTYAEMEKDFRARGLAVFLIGLEKESGPTFTNVDLQGTTGKTYAIGYFFSEKPSRPTMVDKWPKTPEENLERLDDVGIPMDRGVPVCNNW